MDGRVGWSGRPDGPHRMDCLDELASWLAGLPGRAGLDGLAGFAELSSEAQPKGSHCSVSLCRTLQSMDKMAKPMFRKTPPPPNKKNRSPTHAGTRVGPLEPHPKQNNTNEQKTICKAAQACLEKAQGPSRCTRPLRCARGPVGRAWPHYWGIGPPIIQGYGFMIVAQKRK